MEHFELEHHGVSSIPPTNTRPSGAEGGIETEDRIGRDSLEAVFKTRGKSDNGPERYEKAMAYLINVLNLEEAQSPDDILNELVADPEATSIISGILSGDFDGDIASSKKELTEGKLGRTDVYALALYIYGKMDRPKGEAEKVLGKMISSFDDPTRNYYELGLIGLDSTPDLTDLCNDVIQRMKLQEGIRKEIMTTLENLSGTKRESFLQELLRGNAYSVNISLKD